MERKKHVCTNCGSTHTKLEHKIEIEDDIVAPDVYVCLECGHTDNVFKDVSIDEVISNNVKYDKDAHITKARRRKKVVSKKSTETDFVMTPILNIIAVFTITYSVIKYFFERELTVFVVSSVILGFIVAILSHYMD